MADEILNECGTCDDGATEEVKEGGETEEVKEEEAGEEVKEEEAGEEEVAA